MTVEGFAPRKVLTWIRHAGGAPSLEGNDPLGHRLWIQHEQPDVYRKTATFLEPLDFLNARFTGRIRATPVSMLLSWLCDNRRLDQDRYDPALGHVGHRSRPLPPLVPIQKKKSSVVGELSRPWPTPRLPEGVRW